MNIKDFNNREDVQLYRFKNGYKRTASNNDCKFLFSERCYHYKNQLLNGEKIFDLCTHISVLEAMKCLFYKTNETENFKDGIVISNFRNKKEYGEFNIIIFNDKVSIEVNNLIVEKEFNGFMGFKVYSSDFLSINHDLEISIISRLKDCGLLNK